MNGREKEATEIVNATMPATLAQNILPYLTQMDRLNPGQDPCLAALPLRARVAVDLDRSPKRDFP